MPLPTQPTGPESAPDDHAASEPRHIWQMLDAEVHMHTLKPDYAPVGLLEMVASPPARILDVGCFCGGSGRWLKARFPHCGISGIEMLDSAAAIAAEAYDHVITGPIEQIDFAANGLTPGSMDAIIAADVLEHLYNPWKALQRLRPLLAPGGAIYISVPNIRNLNILVGLAKGHWNYAGAGILDITHIRFFTRAQAVEMLEQTGWKVCELRINPDPRLLANFKDVDLNSVEYINAGSLKLDNLTPEDVIELLALQFFIHAEPVL